MYTQTSSYASVDTAIPAEIPTGLQRSEGPVRTSPADIDAPRLEDQSGGAPDNRPPYPSPNSGEMVPPLRRISRASSVNSVGPNLASMVCLFFGGFPVAQLSHRTKIHPLRSTFSTLAQTYRLPQAVARWNHSRICCASLPYRDWVDLWRIDKIAGWKYIRNEIGYVFPRGFLGPQRTMWLPRSEDQTPLHGIYSYSHQLRPLHSPQVIWEPTLEVEHSLERPTWVPLASTGL